MSSIKLVVGLGNPGKKYEKTRHNVGWMVLDALAGGKRWQESKKAKALYLKKEIVGQTMELLKPTTFMNNSGIAVAYAMRKHGLEPSDLIIIHDDKDLTLGEIRVHTGHGSAGHKGAQSIMDHLGTKDFTRVRVGIAPPDASKMGDASDFVLGKFTREEKKKLGNIFAKAIEEIKKLL